MIKATNLTKKYGANFALKDMDFEIEEGKLIGLIGRNGAGKTTLMKIMCGNTSVTSGKLEVFGKNPFNSLFVSERTIFISENMSFSQKNNLKEIIENMAVFYKNYDVKLAMKLLEYFEINTKLCHGGLSKGTKSLFNSIAGLCAHCELTIMDEPITGMDIAVRKDFYKLLLKDYIENPRTIIVSSHLLSELENIIEDIVLIHKGKTVLNMPVTDLKEYAVGITCDGAAMKDIVQKNQILYSEIYDEHVSYFVIKSEAYKEKQQSFDRLNARVQSVKVEDLCMYLTSKGEGGVMDAFGK